jgi:hypothetical protein
MGQKLSPSRQFRFTTVASIVQLILLIVAFGSVMAASSQQRRFQQSEIVLEVTLPNSSESPLRLQASTGGRISTLINRQQLIINDPKLAGDFTAIDIWVDRESDAIKVRLSIIYNDLSDQEWWKDKKEKIAGSLFIREGESARLTQLAQFGIEPFEMKAIDARPIVIQPETRSLILNNTNSLEVVRIEKSLGVSRLRIKNNSSKNVVAFTVLTNHRHSTSGVSYRAMSHPFAPGATSDEILLSASDVEQSSITIPVVVFDDESFEGDIKLAAQFLVNQDGIKIQAPHVLRMIEQTLEADDAELQSAFDKLEAQLWVIPEAIDKQSAIELLRSKYPWFDDKTISRLYEDLKGGLYDARSRALSPLGDIKRGIKEDERQDPDRAVFLRKTLERIKSDFERITAAKK